jgi:hypothetical protein
MLPACFDTVLLLGACGFANVKSGGSKARLLPKAPTYPCVRLPLNAGVPPFSGSKNIAPIGTSTQTEKKTGGPSLLAPKFVVFQTADVPLHVRTLWHSRSGVET